jgi:hypothetical protein
MRVKRRRRGRREWFNTEDIKSFRARFIMKLIRERERAQNLLCHSLKLGRFSFSRCWLSDCLWKWSRTEATHPLPLSLLQFSEQLRCTIHPPLMLPVYSYSRSYLWKITFIAPSPAHCSSFSFIKSSLFQRVMRVSIESLFRSSRCCWCSLSNGNTLEGGSLLCYLLINIYMHWLLPLYSLSLSCIDDFNNESVRERKK